MGEIGAIAGEIGVEIGVTPDMNPFMVSTMDVVSKKTTKDTLIAAGEIVELRFPDHKRSLPLRAAKLLHLLIDAAGPKACDDIEHKTPIAELNFPHLEGDALVDCIRDLQQTLVEFRYIDAEGQSRIKSAPFLADVDRPEELQNSEGWVTFRLSNLLRLILKNSHHWAALSRDAVLAFESRYALRLYELMTLRGGLTHKNTETFDLEDLRRRLGVPTGKMTLWNDFRRYALERAIAEVNQLSGLEVSYEAFKRGRRVDRVTLRWSHGSPEGRGKAAVELAQHSVERKDRRDGNNKPIAPSPPRLGRTAFPEHGTIRHGTERRIWLEIAEQHAQRLQGGHLPDLGGLAEQFRTWCDGKGIPLDAPGIEKTFIGFCQKYRPLMGQS